MENSCRYYHVLHRYQKKKKTGEQISEEGFCHLRSQGEAKRPCSYGESQRDCPDYEEEEERQIINDQ